MNQSIPFLDLRVQDGPTLRKIQNAVEGVLRHGQFIMGPEVRELEDLVARYCGRRYAVGLNSGTDALYLALKSLDIGPGDEVITTALSWIATANAIRLTGATPVFADIGEDLNIDSSSVRAQVTNCTRAIVPVHYAGRMCDMPSLTQIADEHGLHIVEDAAQAFGAELTGRKAGAFGTLGAFSMNPMKVFAACGEAGMVVTNSPGLHARLIRLRYNGMENHETCVEPGLNGRLDTLQAAILLAKWDTIDQVIETRRRIAARYDELLEGVVKTPAPVLKESAVYYTYNIRTDRRAKLKSFLDHQRIEAKVRDPILMPEQPAYRHAGSGSFPNAKRIVNELLSIPAHEKMTLSDVERVARAIRTFFERS